MSRKKIIAGNWKMNKTVTDAHLFIDTLNKKCVRNENLLIYIAPPVLFLENLIKENRGKITFGAQNCHEKEEGAFTGEVSANMLASINCQFVILGHSERRQFYFENDENISKKINAALKQGLQIIYCCGESLEQRNNLQHFHIIKSQIETALFSLNEKEIAQIIIAYEPVWAIGTGITASTSEAEEMHAFIRNLISSNYGAFISNEISILYGGSVKPSNALELFSQDNIDGGLIGGASLNVEDFLSILNMSYSNN